MVAHIWPAAHGAGQDKAGGDDALGYAIGLTAWFLVGGVYVAAKFGVEEMPPWSMCFFRLLIATLVLLPLVWKHRKAMAAFLGQRWLAALVIGALGLGLTQGLIYTALTFTSATNTGIIFSIAPILTMILAGVLLREPLGLWQYLGSAVAFVGIVVTAVQGSLAVLLGLDFGSGDLLVVVAAVFFSIYTVGLKWAKFNLDRLPLLVILIVAGVIATFPGTVIEFAHGDHANLAFKGYIALAYAAIPGGALMYLLYNWSVGILGASRAGALLYSQMVFTAILAWAILGEAIHWYQVAGAALIVGGVLLIAVLKPNPVPIPAK